MLPVSCYEGFRISVCEHQPCRPCTSSRHCLSTWSRELACLPCSRVIHPHMDCSSTLPAPCTYYRPIPCTNHRSYVLYRYRSLSGTRKCSSYTIRKLLGKRDSTCRHHRTSCGLDQSTYFLN